MFPEAVEGRSIAALARAHGVSRGAIRTAVADLLPDQAAIEEDSSAPELPVTLDMPGKLAGFLRATELDPVEWDALDQGGDRTARPGPHPARHRRPGSAPPAPRPLPAARRRPGRSGGPGPAQARREYENRVSALAPTTP
ncbi:resolvase [Streptomyces cinnamoneus]|uniref:resolvase n=1 Tax=Streptomyces cinnamoneus TaxID=53446 RepID=UPI003414106D